MKSLKFTCKLLSDIILSEQAATEGAQRTLDYIPGNVFLGIVASKIYQAKSSESMHIFHSGKVRFGDALPMAGESRSIQVPASWHIAKGSNLEESDIFIHPFELDHPTTQCRKGYIYKVSSSQFKMVQTGKDFAIKSAFDRDKRHSKDQAMYGYQSLNSDAELGFQIDMEEENNEIETKIIKALVGCHNIGRSKTAEYGRVGISESIFATGFNEKANISTGCTFLYAESRLIFLNEFGQPTANPTHKLLGIENANIDLERSQIRTFRYSPYNHKRKSRDADRFGIEKGSIICISKELNDNEKVKIRLGIGLFLNEGFGKVLINPEFLIADETKEHKSIFGFKPDQDMAQPAKRLSGKIPATVQNSEIWKFLQKRKQEKVDEHIIYKLVNEFVADAEKHKRFNNESFASQWGTIRQLAMKNREFNDLKNKLFYEPNENGMKQEGKQGYLVHGVAKAKWEEKGRIDALKEFVKQIESENKAIASEAIINLASEMAKKCRRK